MTEKPDTPAAAAPAARPAAQAPAQASPAPAARPGDLSVREEAELGRLLAQREAAAAGPDPVRLKVEPPHAALTYGGVTVASEFTTVPSSMVAAVTEAAAEAGVKITQET